MKRVLLLLMLAFGMVSVAYAQDTTSGTADTDAVIDYENVSPRENLVPNDYRPVKKEIKKVKEARTEFLKDRKQALEARAEKAAELKTTAQEVKSELKAQFDAATTTEAKAAVREEAKTKREELRVTAQTYKEEWRERVKDYFKQRVEATFKRFAAHVDKAERVDARIVTVLAKLEAASIDTSAVKTSLEAARTNIADAESTMSSVRTTIETVVETGSKSEVRAAFAEAKTEIKTATQALKAAYLDIRKAVAELKALIETEKDEEEEEEEENEDDDEDEEDSSETASSTDA